MPAGAIEVERHAVGEQPRVLSGQAPDAQHRQAQLRRRGLCADAGHLVEQRHDVARRLQHPGFDLVAVDDRDGNGLVVDASAGARARHDRACFLRGAHHHQADGALGARDDIDTSRRRLVSVLRGDDREQPGGSVSVPTPDASVAVETPPAETVAPSTGTAPATTSTRIVPVLRLCRISVRAGKAEAEGQTSHEKGGQNGTQSGWFLPGGLPP